MAQGDVEVRIVDADVTAIDAAITAMRNTAGDHWLMTSVSNGLQVCIVNIWEA